MSDFAEQERQHRQELWQQLIAAGGPLGVPARILRSLGIYGGAQGIWEDKRRTKSLTPDGAGVTVAVLHNGMSYPDDVSEDGILYHYPLTRRPEARDRSEIESTKSAAKLNLPLFVITYTARNFSKRDVHLGWVAGWDDASKEFLITFGATPAQVPEPEREEEEPFQLQNGRAGKIREVERRTGQTGFKFRVLRRYGPRCAACNFEVLAVLDAAHLFPKSNGGTDDPRNGIVFCAAHHRAFDAGLFIIEPRTLAIHSRANGPSLEALRIKNADVSHLLKKPHQEALEWCWSRWSETNSSGILERDLRIDSDYFTEE